MKCKKIRFQIVDLLDGTLPAEETHAVRQHLADCLECSQWLAREQELGQVIHGAVLQVTPEFHFQPLRARQVVQGVRITSLLAVLRSPRAVSLVGALLLIIGLGLIIRTVSFIASDQTNTQSSSVQMAGKLPAGEVAWRQIITVGNGSDRVDHTVVISQDACCLSQIEVNVEYQF